MKVRSIFTVFTLVALLGLVVSGSFAGTAYANSGPDGGGRSLSASGAAAPRPTGYSRGPARGTALVPVPDGGFENGPPPGSLWTEKTSTTCEWILDPTPVWGIPARSGTYAFWAGGYCGPPNSDLVKQNVLVPAGETMLNFYAVYYRVDSDDPPLADYFFVKVKPDGGTVRRVFTKEMSQANNTFPNFVLEQVDLSAYAGQNITLIFGGLASGDLSGNVLVDDITWEAP